MSGLEILGVILGAMPLLISALEGYQKLGKKRDAFRRKSMHIDRMIRALDWQQKLIRSDVRLVMRNAGLEFDDDYGCDDDEKEKGEGEGKKKGEGEKGKEKEKKKENDFSVGRYQDLFNRPDVQKAVMGFLRDNSSAYVEVLQQCESAILRIAKAIEGFEEGGSSWKKVANGSLTGLLNPKPQPQPQPPIPKPPGSTTTSTNTFLKKLKFSMHKDEISSSIAEIDQLSRLLERLREKSHQEHSQIILTQQTRSASSKGAVSMLRKVQIRALRLYRALAASWTRACDGENPHGARLYLDYRADGFGMSGSKKMSLKKSSQLEFSVTLRSCTRAAAGPPCYQSCIVEALDGDDFEGDDDDDDEGKDRKATVSFRTILDDGTTTTSTRTTSTTTTQKLTVDNICHILDQSSITKQSLKLYLFPNEKLYYEQHLSSSPSTPPPNFQLPTPLPKPKTDEKMVSLQDLLQDPTYRHLLQLKPRVKLAAIMASSALQLHATPWCRGLLRNNSLLFLKDDVSGTIHLGRPFVACDFQGGGKGNNYNDCNYNNDNDNNNSNNDVSSALSSSSQAESELLDLGILILELWHHETMEHFARDSGLALDDMYDTRQSVARKWITATKDDLLTSIYDAAVRCINCRFDAVDLDLSTNHKLNLSIFDSVVKPLWENCRA